MLKKLLACCVFVGSLLMVAGTNAQEAPEKSIEGAVQQLLDEFTTRRGELENDRAALYAMVDRITRPHFDFNRISKLILAKNWKKASEQQRTDFGEEFRTLLIRTYATALFQYTGKEKMAFTATKIKEKNGIKSARVESEVVLSDGPGIPVYYSMILDQDNSWKIYNMTIAGVNMVTSYRKTYGASIRSQGIDGLIEAMKASNNKI